MARSHFALRPPQLIDGPPCPGCGAILCVVSIEPDNKPDYELLTFECAWCEHKQLVSAKREPQRIFGSKSKTQDTNQKSPAHRTKPYYSAPP
jgi:hypothetical protein